jgi:hypothetical protein
MNHEGLTTAEMLAIYMYPVWLSSYGLHSLMQLPLDSWSIAGKLKYRWKIQLSLQSSTIAGELNYRLESCLLTKPSCYDMSLGINGHW